MRLSDALAERGLTNEDAARLLTAAGVMKRKGASKGEPYTVDDLKKRSGSTVSPLWADAFGITLEASPSAAGGEDASGAPEPSPHSPGRAQEQPPRRPKNAPVQPTALPAQSGKRIATGYRFVGGLASVQVSRTHGKNAGNGIATVFEANADPIADLWIKVAEENAAVARFVNAVNGGGVAGDLIGAHIILALSCLYIMGAPLPEALFAKYSQYRVVVEQPKPSPAAKHTDEPEDPRVNGATVSTTSTTMG